MLRASIASTERAFPFIIGGSLLAATSGWRRWCFFVSFDIKLAAVYALGVASVLSISGRAVGFRSLGALVFGLALIMESAGAFRSGGAGLCFVTQSSVAVMVFAIGLGVTGVLSDDQVIISIYGSWVGANIILLPLPFNLAGTLRSIAMFQLFYNVPVAAVHFPFVAGDGCGKYVADGVHIQPDSLGGVYGAGADSAGVAAGAFRLVVVLGCGIVRRAESTAGQ